MWWQEKCKPGQDTAWRCRPGWEKAGEAGDTLFGMGGAEGLVGKGLLVCDGKLQTY